MKNKITEVLGWYGITAIMIAYLLNSFEIMNNTSLWYQILNLTGAIGITADALDDKNTQPAVLNIIWAIIALVAIVKMFI